MKKGISAFLLVLLLVSSVFADEKEQIENRIKPLGQVQLIGDKPLSDNASNQAIDVADNAKPKETKAAGGDADGKAVYSKYCVACHSTGLAGAPKIGDKASWGPRNKKGITALVASAKKGLNAMPPKGTCATCTDAQLKAAIEFMQPK